MWSAHSLMLLSASSGAAIEIPRAGIAQVHQCTATGWNTYALKDLESMEMHYMLPQFL